MSPGEARLAAQRALWDAEAAGFDDEPDHGLADPDCRAAWRTLLARALPAPPSDVVDLGSGTGSLAVLLAGLGHRVRATDLSPAMAELARAKADAAGVALDVEVGDAGEPSYDDSSADVALCRHVLWALPDPAAALDRWHDLLRPGGRLVLVEGRWHTGGGLTAEESSALVGTSFEGVRVEHLCDPVLWGGPLRDERYLLTARRSSS